ncbi:hypothetical protein HNR46_001674 [Haloferula luteola]|uniref:Uncharacterized protein n=1 Tax=Haloferula luteola TaxID=595692 RepID=A0A840V9S0_9BACT|nr:DUF3634 family protein [Haloferula luteola]MBB5351438.1 hypothetical protein [Haloferula luteola]
MKFLSRLFSETAIEIRSGQAILRKGKHHAGMLSDITSMAREHDLSRGEIWIESTGKIHFSHEIPKDLHQRFRNTLVLSLS